MPPVSKVETKKYLVIPNLGMGDAIMSLSALFKIKTIFPSAQTSVLCWGERWTDVYKDLNYISRIIIADPLFEQGTKPARLETESRDLIAGIISEHDVVISLCGMESIEAIIKEKKSPEERYIWSAKDEPAPSYFESLSQGVNRFLGMNLDWHALMSPASYTGMPDKLKEWMILNLKGKKMAVIAVGAGAQLRKLPISIFLKIYLYLLSAGYTPVAIVPNDSSKDYYMKFFEKYKIKALEFAFLSDAFEFISISSLYVGPDTGFSHFSAVKRVPTVTVMGPSNSFFGPFGPRAAKINYGEKCEFQNRPCDSYGKCEYRGNGAKCLSAFDVSDLEDALTKIKVIEAF